MGLRLHHEIGTLESLKHGDKDGVDGGEWTRRSGLDGDVCKKILQLQGFSGRRLGSEMRR
jgi:hypothetical protein